MYICEYIYLDKYKYIPYVRPSDVRVAFDFSARQSATIYLSICLSIHIYICIYLYLYI